MKIFSRFWRWLNWKISVAAGALLAVLVLCTADTFWTGFWLSLGITICLAFLVVWVRLLVKGSIYAVFMLCGIPLVFLCLPSVMGPSPEDVALMYRGMMRRLVTDCFECLRKGENFMDGNSLKTSSAECLNIEIQDQTSLPPEDFCLVFGCVSPTNEEEVSPLVVDYAAWKRMKNNSLYQNWLGLPVLWDREKSVLVQFQDAFGETGWETANWVSSKGFRKALESTSPTATFRQSIQSIEETEKTLHHGYTVLVYSLECVLFLVGLLAGIKMRPKSPEPPQDSTPPAQTTQEA